MRDLMREGFYSKHSTCSYVRRLLTHTTSAVPRHHLRLRERERERERARERESERERERERARESKEERKRESYHYFHLEPSPGAKIFSLDRSQQLAEHDSLGRVDRNVHLEATGCRTG
jgi:hypothetical protein